MPKNKKFTTAALATGLLLGGGLSVSAGGSVAYEFVTVEAGDTFWELAEEYGVAVDDMLEDNAQFDPAALPIGAQVKVNVEDERHFVQAGDTLSEIAAIHGIDLATLFEYNPEIVPTKLMPGDAVVIGPGADGVVNEIEDKAHEEETSTEATEEEPSSETTEEEASTEEAEKATEEEASTEEAEKATEEEASTEEAEKATEEEASTEEEPVEENSPEAASGAASELLSQGDSTSFVFNETGEFNIYCQPHPTMKMTVVVEDGAEQSEEVAIDIADYAFGNGEETITIAPGTTIVWTNQDVAQHNVAFK